MGDSCRRCELRETLHVYDVVLVNRIASSVVYSVSSVWMRVVIGFSLSFFLLGESLEAVVTKQLGLAAPMHSSFLACLAAPL